MSARTKPGARVNTTRFPWGQATGRHLLEDPKIPPAHHTPPHWTQAQRDAFVAIGILPAQADLFAEIGQ